MPSPQSLMVRREFPDHYTTSEVADIVGRSKGCILRWRKDGILEPSHYMESGTTVIWLYTEDDLAKAKQIVRTMHPGRKPDAVKQLPSTNKKKGAHAA